jgi:hypothetical protein
MHVVLVVLLVLVFLGGEAVVARVKNGGRVGPKTTLGPDGLVAGDPQDLAAAAGLSLQTYALARALVSEHGSDPDAYLRAVAWAIRNKAAEKRVSIFVLVTDGRGTAGDGRFGEQKASAGTKYVSTAKDPSERHVRIAEEVETAPASADPTGGATHFFSPKTQDLLAAKAAAGDERFTKYAGRDAAAIFASWSTTGLYPGGAVPVVPPGVDGDVLTLWRRA